MDVATDMLGTPLVPGQYVALAATNMLDAMIIVKIIRIDSKEKVYAKCVRRCWGPSPDGTPAYYSKIWYQGVVLPHYQE